MKKIMLTALCIITLCMLSLASMFAQNKDSVKKTQPFVKELGRDSIKYKTPIQKLDTMKNNMPVVNPKKKNEVPK